MFRLISLVALPVVEVLLLSFLVDAATLGGKAAWWAAPLSSSGKIATVMFVFAAVIGLAVCSRPADKIRIQYLRTVGNNPKKWSIFLSFHVLLFIMFSIVTTWLVEGEAASSAHSNIWFLSWAFLGFAMAACWCAAIMPLDRWWNIGKQYRQYLPVIIVAAAIAALAWATGLVAETFWVPLLKPSFEVARALLQFFGLEVVCDPDTYMLGTKIFTVKIASACSGHEGIALILALLGTYFWFFRKELRFPRVLLLVPLGAITIWLANAARIAAIIMMGTQVSDRIALGGFHSRLGPLLFVAVSLGMVTAAHHLSFFRQSTKESIGKRKDATTAYLMPLLTLVGMIMLTGLFTSGFDWLYPVRVLATGGVILVYWSKSWTWDDLRQMWSIDAIASGVVVFFIWLAFHWHYYGPVRADSAITAGLADASSLWAATWIIFRIIGAVITVPVAEELAFRGYLLRRLTGPDFEGVSPRQFTWFSFLVSSILFGVMHDRWAAGTVAGMFYAGVVYRQGRLSHAIAAHGVTNALIAAYVLTGGNWSLW